MDMIRSILLFIVAGLFDIGGGYSYRGIYYYVLAQKLVIKKTIGC
jgi:drug/metabolite transporter superfamily protein YnfA